MSTDDELQEWYSQRDALGAALDLDPDNDELLAMKVELDTQIKEMETAAAQKTAPPPQSAPAAEAPKWDKTKHPAFQKQGQQSVAEEPVSIVFRQNDLVMARWPKDRQFYEARITSVTGSSADPVYYVKYTKYDEHASLRSHDVKPLPNQSRKRKADEGAPANVIPSPTAPPPVTANSNVISAPSTVDPSLAAKAKKDPSQQPGDGSSRPNKALRQMPKSKALRNAKDSWQSFQKKQGGRKESMFRTQEGNPNARVGFTGSGHEMRKDVARKRHMYDKDDEDDAR